MKLLRSNEYITCLCDIQMLHRGYEMAQDEAEVILLNSCKLTASITALANAIACKMTDDELTLLGVTLTQLGDTILTIATQRSICKPK